MLDDILEIETVAMHLLFAKLISSYGVGDVEDFEEELVIMAKLIMKQKLRVGKTKEGFIEIAQKRFEESLDYITVAANEKNEYVIVDKARKPKAKKDLN